MTTLTPRTDAASYTDLMGLTQSGTLATARDRRWKSGSMDQQADILNDQRIRDQAAQSTAEDSIGWFP
jgi:hypothetical protein